MVKGKTEKKRTEKLMVREDGCRSSDHESKANAIVLRK